MARVAACGLALGLVALTASAVAAQPSPREPLALHVHRLEHQPVGEAASLIYPLLSERGRVELRPGEGTLIIRDVRSALDRIVPLLREFDQPARAMGLSVQIVSAEGRGGRAIAGKGLSEELVQRLHELLRYDRYRLIAGADMEVKEGLDVTHEVGTEYRVEFQIGRVRADRRVKLSNFKVLRQTDGAPRQLIHTNLNLWLDRPLVLGLARTESSERALMIIVDCSLERGAAEVAN